MISGYETVMVALLARLQAPPHVLVTDVANIRRAHRTAVPRANAPAWHLLDGSDASSSPKSKCERNSSCTVRIMLRADAGASAADPHKIDIMRRLHPQTAPPYPAGVHITPGSIVFDTEVADADVVNLDMTFPFSYPADEWSLG